MENSSGCDAMADGRAARKEWQLKWPLTLGKREVSSSRRDWISFKWTSLPEDRIKTADLEEGEERVWSFLREKTGQ